PINVHARRLPPRYPGVPRNLPLTLPAQREHARHVYHLYVVRTPRRDELAAFLKERGIQTGVHYPVPTHRQPAVEALRPATLARTERLVEEILSLPMSANHTPAEIDQVTAAGREFFARLRPAGRREDSPGLSGRRILPRRGPPAP